MNREQRRHPTKGAKIRQLLDDLSTVHKFKDVIEGEWPLQDGDKVRLNLKSITGHPGYKNKIQDYQTFCEENAGRVFTVGVDPSIGQGVVYLKEDQKWLFWIGDLEKVEDNNG